MEGRKAPQEGVEGTGSVCGGVCGIGWGQGQVVVWQAGRKGVWNGNGKGMFGRGRKKEKERWGRGREGVVMSCHFMRARACSSPVPPPVPAMPGLSQPVCLPVHTHAMVLSHTQACLSPPTHACQTDHHHRHPSWYAMHAQCKKAAGRLPTSCHAVRHGEKCRDGSKEERWSFKKLGGAERGRQVGIQMHEERFVFQRFESRAVVLAWKIMGSGEAYARDRFHSTRTSSARGKRSRAGVLFIKLLRRKRRLSAAAMFIARRSPRPLLLRSLFVPRVCLKPNAAVEPARAG